MIFVFYKSLSAGKQNLYGTSTAFRPQIGPVYRTMATTLMGQETFMNVDQYLGGGYIRAYSYELESCALASQRRSTDDGHVRRIAAHLDDDTDVCKWSAEC